MEGWLKGLVATACVVIISCGGYYAWNELKGWRLARSEAAAANRMALDRRAHELAIQGCRPQIEELLKMHAERPITSASEIPTGLRQDVTICLNRDIAFAFEKNEMERTGLAKLMKATSE